MAIVFYKLLGGKGGCPCSRGRPRVRLLGRGGEERCGRGEARGGRGGATNGGGRDAAATTASALHSLRRLALCRMC